MDLKHLLSYSESTQVSPKEPHSLDPLYSPHARFLLTGPLHTQIPGFGTDPEFFGGPARHMVFPKWKTSGLDLLELRIEPILWNLVHGFDSESKKQTC